MEVQRTQTFLVRNSVLFWAWVPFVAACLGLFFSALIILNTTPNLRAQIVFLASLAAAVFGLILPRLVYRRIEVSPDRLMLHSQVKSVVIRNAESNGVIGFDVSNRGPLPSFFLALPNDRRPTWFLPANFDDSLELRQIVMTKWRSHDPIRALAVSERESRGWWIALAVITAVTILLCYVIQRRPSFVFGWLVIKAAFAYPLVTLRLTETGIELKMPKTFVPYDQITSLTLTPEIDGKAEHLTVHYGENKAKTIYSSETNFALIRDTLLVRAVNAQVTGETDPDKLHHCALSGPLDQLHAKPLNPTTTNQDEETVRA